MHMLVVHAVAFCDTHRCGLLPFSEESSESLHSKFAHWYQQMKVPKPENPNFADFLIRTVSALNSAHIVSRSGATKCV